MLCLRTIGFFEVFSVFSVSYFLIIVRGERKGIRYSLANMPGLRKWRIKLILR